MQRPRACPRSCTHSERGTLVLLASAAYMRAANSQLPGTSRRVSLLQARHRAAIDRGESSVLFGLQSLAEGIDPPPE